MPGRVLILFCIVVFAGRLFAGEPAERVDFNSQIRPILSDRCFKCHGPDAGSRKADLRLDISESALASHEKKPGPRVVVPRKPDQSEIVRRITSSDPDEQMPPPDSNLKISAEEIALIRQGSGKARNTNRIGPFIRWGKFVRRK